MGLNKEIVKTGNFLFRYRSQLPLMLLFLYACGIFSNSINEELIILSTWQWLSFSISMVGLIIRIITVSRVPVRTSGRNTKLQRADVLNHTGIYSIVRHPLYLGNYFIWSGMFALLSSIWIFIIFSLLYWLYYERIMLAEEAFLISKFSAQFEKWSECTPAFMPSFKNYKPNLKPFNLKMVIRREYTTFSAILILFVILIYINEGLLLGNWKMSQPLINYFIIVTIVYFFLRTLKKLGKL